MRLKKDGTLIVLSGPSGVGKDTIERELLKRNKNLFMSVSMTTREKRNKEVDEIDYYFITKDEFEKNIEANNFLEYAIVHDNYYGTPKDKVLKNLEKGNDVLLEIDIQGALKIKKQYKKAIFIFLMPPDMKTLRDRLINRKTESIEKVIKRFKTAYKEINKINRYNYVVINDKVENAVKKIEAILISEKCSVSRIEDLELGNQEELIHELMTEY